MYLLRWSGDDPYPDTASAFSLKGKLIDSEGFIILCNRNAANDDYDEKCDDIIGTGGPADSDGYDQIAIVLGDPIGECYTTIDIFGVPGEDGAETDHDFKDSRAVRKPGVG